MTEQFWCGGGAAAAEMKRRPPKLPPHGVRRIGVLPTPLLPCSPAPTPTIVSAPAGPYIPRRPERERTLGDTYDLSSLINEFRDEARIQLELLDAALLKLERDGELPADQYAALLRGLHTLKGNSGMLGYGAMRDYVHGIESVMRQPAERWPQALLDRLFAGAAALRSAVEALATEREGDALARLAAEPRADAPFPVAAEAPRESGSPATPAVAGAPAPAPAAENAPEAPSAEVPADSGHELLAATETLRVPARKLDVLVNQVAELVGIHGALESLLAEHRVVLEAAGLRRTFAARVEELDRVGDALRTSVGALRLVPVARVFRRFPSLIRNLAQAQGKRIEVVLEGEDTELDKSTVDVLAEPLLHLVRNAVDHGIGTPEERERLGKPPVGTITLRARQRGDTVQIEVEDDGLGLDLERILARARSSGLVGADERPDHAEITDLIFRPGFSTRSEADEVSGRGIGMDVVATTVARLRGHMTVRAEPGEGTRFIMELPLTLAVLPVLLFEAAGEMMALPTADVEETRRVYAVRRVAGAEVIAHDDTQIPLARPAALFGWDAAGEGPPPPPPYAVVVRRGARVVAVAADRLIEQREVVVKALPRFLGPLRGVSGASIAPDGRVVLLLDAGNVITLNLDSHRRSERASISR